MIIPNIWENKKCSKPPTSDILSPFISNSWIFIWNTDPQKTSKIRSRPWDPRHMSSAAGWTATPWEQEKELSAGSTRQQISGGFPGGFPGVPRSWNGSKNHGLVGGWRRESVILLQYRTICCHWMVRNHATWGKNLRGVSGPKKSIPLFHLSQLFKTQQHLPRSVRVRQQNMWMVAFMANRKVNLPLPSPFDHGSGYAMLWLAAHAMPGPTWTNQYFMPEMTIQHSSFEAGHYEYETIVNHPIRWCTLWAPLHATAGHRNSYGTTKFWTHLGCSVSHAAHIESTDAVTDKFECERVCLPWKMT